MRMLAFAFAFIGAVELRPITQAGLVPRSAIARRFPVRG